MGVDAERESKNFGRKNLKLDFATTLKHQFHVKLGIKPSRETYGQSHMQTLWSSTRVEKILASKFSLIRKNP